MCCMNVRPGAYICVKFSSAYYWTYATESKIENQNKINISLEWQTNIYKTER